MSEEDHRFSERRRLMTVRKDAMEVAQKLRGCLVSEKGAELRALLNEYHPADLADAMLFLSEQEDATLFEALDIAEAAEVLDEVDTTTESRLIKRTDPDRLADILEELPPDEGADVIGGLSKDAAEHVLTLTDKETAQEIRTLLAYPKDTDGGIMSLGYVDVPDTATQAEALQRFREKKDAEHIFFLYVVDSQGVLCGGGGSAHPPLRRLGDSDPETHGRRHHRHSRGSNDRLLFWKGAWDARRLY